MKLTAQDLRRVRFARLQMQQAKDHFRVDLDARNAACITALQDAVETLLLVVGEKVDASLTGKSFDSYFNAINAKIAPATLPSIKAMMRMNLVRVGAKHHGNFPTHNQVAEFVPIVEEFLSEVTERWLNISWAGANLSSLIQSNDTRGLLQEAEEALSQGNFTQAVTDARKAFYLVFEKDYDVSRFQRGSSGNVLLGLGCQAPYHTWSKEWVAEHVRDPFGYIVFDHSKLENDLVKWGIDPTSFWNILRLSPAVFRFDDGRWVVKRDLRKLDREDAANDAVYVVEQVSEMILRVEDRTRLIKSLPYGNRFYLEVKPQALLFQKASTDAAVAYTFTGGERVDAVAETYGLDGAPDWWEVSLFGMGNFITGYLRKTDVEE